MNHHRTSLVPLVVLSAAAVGLLLFCALPAGAQKTPTRKRKRRRYGPWRKLACGGRFFQDALGSDAPAVYELGVASSSEVRVKYVGKTVRERRRLSEYGRSGSHLSDQIDRALAGGQCLYVRSRRLPSGQQAGGNRSPVAVLRLEPDAPGVVSPSSHTVIAT